MTNQSTVQSTVVLQSHTSPLPHDWLAPCLASVRHWAESAGYEYCFVGDELFDLLSKDERLVCAQQPVVASDLARLRLAQNALRDGATRVVWCDADSLVVAPQKLELAADGCAFGRELWLQEAVKNRGSRPRLYRKIHNAFMQFTENDPVLDFYEFAATRMLAKHALGASNQPMVAQFLGPKFLSHLHNVVDFQVLEHAQVISPLLARALLERTPRLIERYRDAWQRPLAIANLCASEVLRGNLDDKQMQRLIDMLQKEGSNAFSIDPAESHSRGDDGYDFGRIVVGIKKGD